MFVRRRSTPASCSLPRTFRRKARSAAGTFPARRTSRGRRRSPRTDASRRPTSCGRSTRKRASRKAPRRSRTAGSASAARTPGSCCATCSATTRCATTTAPGPNGAASSACRSKRGAASPTALTWRDLPAWARGGERHEYVRVRVTRDEMVRQLRRLGIHDELVLDAMARVPREEFVGEDERAKAYGDHALPIAEGQTISQPYVVARMTELLAPRRTDHVLEIGTGSGYQAAVLALLARDVVTVERHASLARTASQRLAALRFENVRVFHDDASRGRPEEAPYDGIVVTAAAPQLDDALVAQLARGGRIVAPVGDQEVQELVVRHADGHEERHGAVRFVPLRGEAGFR